jgi:hypothetical protein
MVTQLFLVQSFKVRVLVDQHKASQEIERLFLCKKRTYKEAIVLI